MTESDSLPAGLREAARAAAQAFMDDVTGITAVVVATVDGFDVASAVRGDQDPARIAAMASSISAISNVVAQEAGLGDYRSVTIGTGAGFAIVHVVVRTDVELVVNVIADASAVLALAMHRIANMSKALAQD